MRAVAGCRRAWLVVSATQEWAWCFHQFAFCDLIFPTAARRGLAEFRLGIFGVGLPYPSGENNGTGDSGLSLNTPYVTVLDSSTGEIVFLGHLPRLLKRVVRRFMLPRVLVGPRWYLHSSGWC